MGEGEFLAMSRAASSRLKSSRSNYKLLSNKSEVDETLFASGNRSRQGRPRSNVGGTSYVSREQMANLIGADSVVIKSAELSRLKDSATVITPQEAAAQAKAKADAKQKTMARARAR